jgi:hypothetical protein
MPHKSVRKFIFPVDTSFLCGRAAPRLGNNWHDVCMTHFSAGLSGWGQAMQPGAIWIIYTLMFGYPVPTHDEHEFTNQAACEIHKHSYSEQIVEAFKLVCSRK